MKDRLICKKGFEEYKTRESLHIVVIMCWIIMKKIVIVF